MKPNFEKIKELTSEIANELGVKETLEKGVCKTKNVVDKATNKVNTYVEAIKEVHENELREKQYALCLEELKKLDGLVIEVLIASVEPLMFTTNIIEHMTNSLKYKTEIRRVVEKSITTSIKENIDKLSNIYSDEIFDLTTFDYELIVDKKMSRSLSNVAKMIVVGREDVSLVFKQKELTFPKGISPHRLSVTKDNVKKRVEKSILYFDITDNDETYTIHTSDIVSIDTFNSLMAGTYQSIDLLCFEPYIHFDLEENEILRVPTRNFVILSAK